MAYAVTALVGLSEPARAQSLADRVAAIRDGEVSFYFAARPGVCGDGEHFVRTGRHSYHGSFSSGRPMEPCLFGPVQVRLTVENGVVHRVQHWVGQLRPREARDLGSMPATEAARYLLTIAARGIPRASAKAIFPAVLADSAIVWPALLSIAKDSDTRSRGTRQEATLWLSRFASGAVAGRSNNPLDFDDDRGASADEELKTHAVFVLSQLPRGEGIPQLLEVARSNASPRVRGQAMFWLGQSGDPRAIALFESVLRS
jgi:HEAT repeat protein